MADQSAELDQHCWNRRSELVYKVRMNIVYHLHLERFYGQLDKWIGIATALSATSAVGSLLRGAHAIEAWAACLTAALSLVPLVFNPAGVAKRHGQLAAEHRKLRAEFERAGQHWTVAQCDDFTAQTVEAEATEPSSLAALVAHAQNQLNVESGGAVVRLTWLQKRLMCCISFDAAKLAKQ